MKYLDKVAKKYHVAEISRMLGLLGRRKRYFLACLAGCCLAPMAFRTVSALLSKTMIDAAVGADWGILIDACIFAGAVLLVGCVADPLFRYHYSRSVRLGMADIRQSIFGKLMELPIVYFEKHHSGDTLSRMTSDLSAMENAFGKQLSSVIVTFGTGLSAAVTMLFLDWRFALPVFVLGFAFMRLNLSFMAPMRRYSDEVQSRKGLAFRYLSDILAGIRVLRVFDVGAVHGRFRGEIESVRAASMKRSKVFGLQSVANHVIATACYVGMLVVGAFLVDAKKSEFGSILAIMGLQQSFNYMLSFLGEFLAQLQESLAGSARVFQLLDAEAEPAGAVSPPPGSEVPSSSPARASLSSLAIPAGHANDAKAGADAAEFRSVYFGYEAGKPVLSDISFEVPEGSFTAIVGRSGSGKTSLMKLLMRYYRIDSGDIRLGGRSIASMKAQELRARISYVPQDSYLFDGTVAENIRFGRPGATEAQVLKAAEASMADGFIRELKDGYDTRVGERGFKLSGGQRQRIGIARALLKDAPLLLLDEATSALDSQSEAQVRDAIAVLMRGRTTLAIAHRFSTIEHADEILVLEGGSIVERGSHVSLMGLGGAYRALRECGQEP